MPDRRMTRRHRLTIEPDPLPEPPGQARMRVGKPDALGANAAVSAPESAQPIPQSHRMLGPRQVVPGAHLRITHVTGSTATAGARKSMNPPSLQLENQPAVVATFHRRHPVIRQTQNPRTITKRSHPPSLVVSTSREDSIESSMDKWDRADSCDVQAAEQTAHPSAVRAGGRVTALRRYSACIQIGEQPLFAGQRFSPGNVNGSRQVSKRKKPTLRDHYTLVLYLRSFTDENGATHGERLERSSPRELPGRHRVRERFVPSG
jgi:hypothetical protein